MLTNVEKVKQAAATLTEMIIELLHWDHEKYAVFQYETGLKYLSLLVENNSFIDYLERSKLFWNWWKLQWYQRDDDYLNNYLKGDPITLGLAYRTKLYYAINNPYHLVTEDKLEASYIQMAKIVRNEIKKNTGD